MPQGDDALSCMVVMGAETAKIVGVSTLPFTVYRTPLEDLRDWAITKYLAVECRCYYGM